MQFCISKAIRPILLYFCRRLGAV